MSKKRKKVDNSGPILIAYIIVIFAIALIVYYSPVILTPQNQQKPRSAETTTTTAENSNVLMTELTAMTYRTTTVQTVATTVTTESETTEATMPTTEATTILVTEPIVSEEPVITAPPVVPPVVPQTTVTVPPEIFYGTEEDYRPLLTDFYKYLKHDSQTFDAEFVYDYGWNGRYGIKSDLYNTGYYLYDINKDGINECIIADIENEEQAFAVYTINNGTYPLIGASVQSENFLYSIYVYTDGVVQRSTWFSQENWRIVNSAPVNADPPLGTKMEFQYLLHPFYLYQ